MATLTGSGHYGRTAMCALVLEDQPVGADSRLEFESFPGEVGETYAVNQYREMGGERMPQPSHIAYRGGNWSPMQLQLIFRAGLRQSARPARAGLGAALGAAALPQQTNPELEQLLVEMEEKVRWCQALTFPLERRLGGLEARRITQQIQTTDAAQRANGLPPTGVTTEHIANMRRNDPPIVLIVFGSWWVQRAYATNVDIKWQSPWHPESVRPYGATVDITFQPLKAQYPTWQLIRNQAGLGGYQSDNPFVTGVVDEARLQQLVDARRVSDNAGARSQTVG